MATVSLRISYLDVYGGNVISLSLGRAKDVEMTQELWSQLLTDCGKITRIASGNGNLQDVYLTKTFSAMEEINDDLRRKFFGGDRKADAGDASIGGGDEQPVDEVKGGEHNG